MPDDVFQDALANAAALYERYLATARLTEFSDLASAWRDEDPEGTSVLLDEETLLDLSRTDV